MKKIWDSQNNESVYAINEEALHRRVKAKKKGAGRIANLNEIGLMLINGATAIFLLIDAIVDGEGFFDYLGVSIMTLTVVYIYTTRFKRKKSEQQFDRTVLGELDHAIARMSSIIKLGSTMVWWYLLPMGLWILAKMIYKEASIQEWLLVLGAFVLAFSLGNWEIRKVHIPKRKHLEVLRDKLKEEGAES